MAGMNEAAVLAGHLAKIIVDGDVIGYAQGVQYNADYTVQDAVVVGSFEVMEQQPTVFRVQGSIQRFRIRDEADGVLKKRTPGKILRQGLFDLEVTDQVSGETIAYIEAVTLSGRNNAVQAGQLVSETTNFKAIRVR